MELLAQERDKKIKNSKIMALQALKNIEKTLPTKEKEHLERLKTEIDEPFNT